MFISEVMACKDGIEVTRDLAHFFQTVLTAKLFTNTMKHFMLCQNNGPGKGLFTKLAINWLDPSVISHVISYSIFPVTR